MLSVRMTNIIESLRTCIRNKKYIICRKNINTITLSYTITRSFYGRQNADISPNMLAVLFYIKQNMNKFKGLNSLINNRNETNNTNDTNETNDNEVDITFKNKTLKAYCYTSKLSDDEEKDKRQKTLASKYNIDLLSNTMSLFEIHDFIKYCGKKYKEHQQKDQNQYIFTYTGVDDEHTPQFRKEKFHSKKSTINILILFMVL